MMKNKIPFILILLSSNIAFSQNSFPSSGANPIIKLQHSADGASAYGYMEFHDVNSRMGYIGFGSTGNTTLHFANETGGNFHFLNGNIGLGIANPGNYKLAIHGTSSSYSTIKLTNDGNASNGIQFGNISSNSNDGEAWNFENGFFRIGTNNQERLRVNSAGNVGIGTTSPNKNLHVSGAWKDQIQFQQSSGTTNYAQLSSGTAWAGLFTGGVADRVMMRAYHDGSKVIFENGNVGIGTTSPSYRLTVNTTDEKHFRFENGSEQAFFSLKNDGNLNLWVHGDDDMIFIRGTGGGTESMRITADGNVGIGSANTFGYKLAVNGTVGAKEVKVENTSPWPDYVFEKDYDLKSLEEVESHIAENGHLPEIPSQAEVKENGINLGEMDAKLLQKVEELTLYLIEQNKEIQALKAKNEELEKRLSNVED